MLNVLYCIIFSIYNKTVFVCVLLSPPSLLLLMILSPSNLTLRAAARVASPFARLLCTAAAVCLFRRAWFSRICFVFAAMRFLRREFLAPFLSGTKLKAKSIRAAAFLGTSGLYPPPPDLPASYTITSHHITNIPSQGQTY